MKRTRAGVVSAHSRGRQRSCDYWDACVAKLSKEILPIVSVIVALAGCSQTDECLTKIEPLSAPNKTITTLGQCWGHDEIVRFYTTNLGTQVAPYKLVMPLELAVPDKSDPKKLVFSGERFFTRSHIEDRWRFLVLEPSDLDDRSDVDSKDVAEGWPTGFVVDRRDAGMSGKKDWQGEWLGPNCAACHTAQIEYTDKTDKNEKHWKIRIPGGPALADINRFLQDMSNSLRAVLQDGEKGGAGFKRYKERYTARFGRPDSTDLLGEKDLLGALRKALDDPDAGRSGWHERNDPPSSIPHGYGRLDAFGEIYNEIIHIHRGEMKPDGVVRNDAPVSLPFLWDFSHNNRAQWNGSAQLIPLVFNVAGALAIFAKFDHQAGWFQDPSTIRLPALREMQTRLHRLRSPAWPQDILGSFDAGRVEKGKELFEAKCRICHAIQERDQPLKYLKVAMTKIHENHFVEGKLALPVDTESKMAENASKPELTDAEGGRKKVSTQLADDSIDIIVSSSHPGEFLHFMKELGWYFFTWKLDYFQKYPDAYKARPLDGIWATAPYLHNGSVPNLYELLLPSTKRIKQFCVGSREFDPIRVGFVMLDEEDCKAKNLHWLDTSKDGNRNIGHDGPGYRVENEEHIWELVEYMKSL